MTLCDIKFNVAQTRSDCDGATTTAATSAAAMATAVGVETVTVTATAAKGENKWQGSEYALALPAVRSVSLSNYLLVTAATAATVMAAAERMTRESSKQVGGGK